MLKRTRSWIHLRLPAANIAWPILTGTAIALIGVSFAFFLVGGRVVDPFDTTWFAADSTAQYYLGWEFFRRETHLTLPLGWSSSIGFPFGEPIAYLDAIPLVAMMFWPARDILPPNFQYLGLYFALNCVLQLYFGYRLSRRLTGDRLAGLAGGVLFMTAPPFVWRALGHFALTTHWLILAAVEIFATTTPHPSKSLTAWSVVLCFLAGATSPYLTFMVLLILAASQIRRLSAVEPVGGKSIGVNLVHAAGSFVICVAAAVAALAIFGFLRWEGVGAYAAPGYGLYSMNLLAPLDPMIFPALLFKAQPTIGHQYEGYNYLGLGVIFLAVITLARRPSIVLALFTRNAAAIWLVFFVSLLLALSTKVTVGSVVLCDLPAPRWVLDALSAFHASGRFFWPAYYFILAGIVIAASTVFKGRMLVVTLTAVVLLQLADLQGLYAKIRTKWETTSSSAVTDGPPWEGLGQYDRHLVVIPAWQCDRSGTPGAESGYWIFGKLAARENMTINSFYGSRWTREQTEYFCEGQLADLKRNGLEKGTAYVFPSWSTLLGVKLGDHHCVAVDGMILCSDRDDRNRD